MKTLWFKSWFFKKCQKDVKEKCLFTLKNSKTTFKIPYNFCQDKEISAFVYFFVNGIFYQKKYLKRFYQIKET